MQQFDVVFIQTLNKFHATTKNTRDIQFIYSICNRQPPNNFSIPYIFYTNKLVQKHNKHVFINTLGPTFFFKAMDINHQSCLPFYKLSNDLNKITSLHFIIQIRKDMLVELCASNHTTYDGLVNGVDGIFKASTTYCNKIIIRIMFQNFKIRTLTKGKYNHYYHNIE